MGAPARLGLYGLVLVVVFAVAVPRTKKPNEPVGRSVTLRTRSFAASDAEPVPNMLAELPVEFAVGMQ